RAVVRLLPPGRAGLLPAPPAAPRREVRPRADGGEQPPVRRHLLRTLLPPRLLPGTPPARRRRRAAPPVPAARPLAPRAGRAVGLPAGEADRRPVRGAGARVETAVPGGGGEGRRPAQPRGPGTNAAAGRLRPRRVPEGSGHGP